ncbi:aldo/keto reductase [bacterium]|jgi:aryl-alcohol dehydrogenase-like predicted oxidoreductase|nr:aldo/keto reductase [bacterium]
MSKLALGTVQFGLDYGILNTTGQAPLEEVKKVLKLAKEHNIDTLDTASSYGNSEEVLGKIGVNDFKIVTKTISLQLGVDNVLQSFYQSLTDLNTTNVDGLLIHNIEDAKDKQFDILYKELDKLKKDKLINKIGFSTYTPDQVDFLLDNFDFDLIQVPFNVFDTRLIEGNQLNLLNKKDVEIHARSVFLQGILLNFKYLDSSFSKWTTQFDDYQKMVKNSGLSLLEYALNFALNTQEIDKVLVGVNNEKQLREVFKSVKEQEALSSYSICDVNLLNPSLWKT